MPSTRPADCSCRIKAGARTPALSLADPSFPLTLVETSLTSAEALPAYQWHGSFVQHPKLPEPHYCSPLEVVLTALGCAWLLSPTDSNHLQADAAIAGQAPLFALRIVQLADNKSLLSVTWQHGLGDGALACSWPLGSLPLSRAEAQLAAGRSIVCALQGMAAAYRGEQQGHHLLPSPCLSRPGWASSMSAFTDTAGLVDPEDLSDEQAASLWPVRVAAVLGKLNTNSASLAASLSQLHSCLQIGAQQLHTPSQLGCAQAKAAPMPAPSADDSSEEEDVCVILPILQVRLQAASRTP